MYKLRVKCIYCGKEWEKDALFPWGPDDCSSSLCRACFVEIAKPLIRKKQLLEGNFDCFGKGGTYCDQNGCKYRQWCLQGDESKEVHSTDTQQGHTNPLSLRQASKAGYMPLS